MGALVKVELKDGTVCKIPKVALDLLLAHDEISKFERSGGWAVIGQDRLRDRAKGRVFCIPERRRSLTSST